MALSMRPCGPGRCARDRVPGSARRRARCCGPGGPFGRRPRASGGCPCSAARSWRRTLEARAGARSAVLHTFNGAAPAGPGPRGAPGIARSGRSLPHALAAHSQPASTCVDGPVSDRSSARGNRPTRVGSPESGGGIEDVAGASGPASANHAGRVRTAPPPHPRPAPAHVTAPAADPLLGTPPRPRGTRRSGPGPPRTRPSPGGARRRRRSPPGSPPGAGGAPESRRGGGT